MKPPNEIEALQKICDTLEPFGPTARRRMLEWLSAKYVAGVRHCGFDTTMFDSPQAWQSLCDRIGLQLTGRCKYGFFVWTGPGIEVVTEANPITGEFHRPELRDNDPGFAGYIGATGDAEKVGEFFNLASEVADFIKEADPECRSFC